MFERKKYKNYYTIGLVLVVVAVWGYNVFQFMDIAQSEERVVTEKQNMDFQEVSLEMPETKNYTFKGNYRDPFSYGNLFEVKKKKPLRQPQSPEPQKRIEKVKRPNIELTGVIELTAIIKTSNNATHFLEKGEELEGMTITDIWDDSVRISYKNKPFTLKISN